MANVGGTLLAYRNACGWCRMRLDAAPMTAGRHAHLPVVRAPLRAAARGALARRRRAPDRAGAAAAQGRPRPAGGRVMDPALVAGLRRFVREPPAAPRRRAERPALRAVPAVAGRGPQAPARPRGAADRLRLPDLLVDALRRGALPADGLAHAVARAVRALRRAVGRVPDPDRPRVLHALDLHGDDRRPLPEPGGGDRVRARPRGLGPARGGQPRARGPRPRRRGADRQPAGGRRTST